MRLRVIAKDSKTGACPTVYDTDSDSDVYVVQGEEFTDIEGLADVEDVLPNEKLVTIPKALLRHLAEES
jgi:hypothetical protein